MPALDRVEPTEAVAARDRRPGDGSLRVDLRESDYYARRRQVLTALRALPRAQVLRLTSHQADDLVWLRYEAEARIPGRYRWSVVSHQAGAAETLVWRL